MKLLFFSRNYSVHDLRFLIKLDEYGYNVTFLPLEESYSGHVSASPENVRMLPALGDTHQRNKLKEIVDELKPDLISAGPIQSCGLLIAKLDFHPFVAMSWGYDILIHANESQESIEVTRKVLEKCDHFVCDCNYIKNLAHEITPVEGKYTAFPWGIENFKDFDKRSELRKDLNIEDSFVILSTRNWEPIYDIDVLLEAFDIIQKKYDNVKLILLGRGSLSDMVYDFIEAKGLTEKIITPGMVHNSEVVDYYLASDLYLSCSRSDGTSISLLEAMAAGIPSVVTDLPSNREWIEEGKNGFLGKLGSCDSFAESISKGISLRQNSGDNVTKYNKQAIKSRADWNKNIYKLFSVYDRLTGN